MLVVELFGGICAATTAFQDLGVPVVTAACEADRDLRAFIEGTYSVAKGSLWDDVKKVTGKQICDIARKCGRHLVAVVVVARPPFTDATELNRHRAGSHGASAYAAQEVKRICDELAQEAHDELWAAVMVFETAMRHDVKDQQIIEDILKAPTIAVHGADWGQSHHSHLFWIFVCQQGPSQADLRRRLADVADLQLPPHTTLTPQGGAWLLKYHGTREPPNGQRNDGPKPHAPS